MALDMLSQVGGAVVGLVIAIMMSRGNGSFQKEMRQAKKNNHVIQFIHNPDNSVTTRTIKMDNNYPNMMIPVTNDMGSNFMLWQPSSKDIETLEGVKTVHYLRGSTPSIPSRVAQDFHLLSECFENENLIPTQDSIICLYDILDHYTDDNIVVGVMNQGLKEDEGYVTDWTLERVQQMRALKREIEKGVLKPMLYQNTKQFLEKSDYNGQNNVRTILNSMESVEELKKDKNGFFSSLNIEPKWLVFGAIAIGMLYMMMNM